jgi:hypothetical protein
MGKEFFRALGQRVRSIRKRKVRIPGQLGPRFRLKLATDSGLKLATHSGGKLAIFPVYPEWVANMAPELTANMPESF